MVPANCTVYCHLLSSLSVQIYRNLIQYKASSFNMTTLESHGTLYPLVSHQPACSKIPTQTHCWLFLSGTINWLHFPIVSICYRTAFESWLPAGGLGKKMVWRVGVKPRLPLGVDYTHHAHLAHDEPGYDDAWTYIAEKQRSGEVGISNAPPHFSTCPHAFSSSCECTCKAEKVQVRMVSLTWGDVDTIYNVHLR